MKNILIIGSGAREHALAWKLRQSKEINNLYVSPGGSAFDGLAESWYISDLPKLAAKAGASELDYILVGQEDYLVQGISEAFTAYTTTVIGPNRIAAQLEGSKIFAKEFMQKHKVPTAAFQKFDSSQVAFDYIDKAPYNLVVKADGLAAGKGVFVCSTKEEAKQSVTQILQNRIFGDAGKNLVIEEQLTGEELSFFIFTDGISYKAMPSVQDYKRQKDQDQGPNTGGMGCFTPAAAMTSDLYKEICKTIVEPTLAGLQKEEILYQGILYIGIMVQNGKPYVIEYNIRFGDPECQLLMMLLETDLVTICEAIAKQKLNDLVISWKEKPGALVVLASENYPSSYPTNIPITGLEKIHETDNKRVFFAGVKKENNIFHTNGGRVLSVCATEDTLKKAINSCYEAVSHIHWKGMQYRTDIGLKGLIKNNPNPSCMNLIDKPPCIGIIMGSASDAPIAKKAITICKEFGVDYEVIVASAHRTPDVVKTFITIMEERGVGAFIALAGLAAHLPGVVASHTVKPVIGVPIASAPLQGQDALLAIVQMPPGIPVATVGINRAENAALLAMQILATQHKSLEEKHKAYRKQMAEKVLATQPDWDSL